MPQVSLIQVGRGRFCRCSLTPFEIKDLVYNADKQMFNGSVLSADGSVKIPIEIYSNAEQAPKDKEELKSGAKITNQFHLEADGELVFDDFFIETKSVRFGAKTEWKTGFRFGPASEALYTKVAQERVVAGASSESEKRAEGRSAKEIGIDLTAAYAEFNEALRTKQSTVAAMGKATKLEQQIFVMAEDKDPNACALGAVLYFNKGNVERKAAGSNPKVARRHYVDALRLAN